MPYIDARHGHYILAPHAAAIAFGWWPLGSDVDVETGEQGIAR